MAFQQFDRKVTAFCTKKNNSKICYTTYFRNKRHNLPIFSTLQRCWWFQKLFRNVSNKCGPKGFIITSLTAATNKSCSRSDKSGLI